VTDDSATGGLSLEVRQESWPIRGGFRIARGRKESAVVVVVTARRGRPEADITGRSRDAVGRGEAVPYARYGESVDGVMSAIRGLDVRGLDRRSLGERLPAGAARAAVDCALLELEARAAGKSAWEVLGVLPPRPVATMRTVSVDSPGAVGEAALALAADLPEGPLKLKLAGDDLDLDRVAAARRAAPSAWLLVDPNEAWTVERLRRDGPALAALGVAMIEQPVPAAADDGLAGLTIEGLTIVADEAVHTRADLDRCAERYGAINVKIDKAGGVTEALALCREARERGLGVMVGCMVCTSLAIAPAFLLAAEAEAFDLDGALLLEEDRPGGGIMRAGLLEPPTLWGYDALRSAARRGS